MTDQTPNVEAVVVGAGFAGLYMVHKLRELGLSFQAFERGGGVGGTWYWNRYPGARCDVESLHYSYSFDPELEQEWDWSERFPSQPEILRYLNHVADRHDLRRLFRFNTTVTAAYFNDSTATWTVETDRGVRISTRYLITAVGCLSRAQVPAFAGLDSFEGEWYHSGEWPHDDVEFTGKRVGLIGTGSSAIQMTPHIAATAKALFIFQRTPNFSIRAGNRPSDPKLVGEVKSEYRKYRERARSSPLGIPFDLNDRSALDDSPELRTQHFEEIWKEGGMDVVLHSYNDLVTNEAANATIAEFVRSKIRDTVKDPATAELLCPHDHPLGTKRLCQDIGYYETFNRKNVKLVDVRSAPIAEITKRGLRLENGDEYLLDVLAFATGYDAMTGALLAINVHGRDGITLEEKWKGGPRTYLGLQIAGFPNLFTITGPGSPSVLSCVPVSIEQHVDWIARTITDLGRRGLDTIEATPDAEAEWVAHVNEAADQTLYPLASSWYLGSNIPGKPRVFMPYVGGVDVYRQKCDEVVAKGYVGFHLSANSTCIDRGSMIG